VIDERKYTGYLFGGNFERGLNKGRLITKVLGYDINNYKLFDSKIKAAVMEFPAKLKAIDAHGVTYEIMSVLQGETGRKAPVLLGAKVKKENSHITTIYIVEIKEAEKDV
jgi:hypothetical protein